MLTFFSDDPVDIKPNFGEGCEMKKDEDDGMFASPGPEGITFSFLMYYLVLSCI